MNAAARALIAKLGLEPLAGEGGFFRQTWRSGTASAIYFLLTAEQFSALHRIEQDELWHFYAGDPVEHVQCERGGSRFQAVRLGPAVLAGDVSQVLVPAGVWQGARLAVAPGAATGLERHGWALVGCTVSPPWDERGFSLASRAELVRAFPADAARIHSLTR
ncbi:MAG: hypothetical protein RL077_3640 [Verrucomicrobiota bacterium]|jgi:predicted cupin superfamily sugar epimerase